MGETTDLIVPNTDVTFTVTRLPRRAATRKTIERLMWMQPGAAKILRGYSRRRKQKDIEPTIRAGRVWFNRPRASRPQRAEVGAEFTLRVTPQIVNDLKSVADHLEAAPAS